MEHKDIISLIKLIDKSDIADLKIKDGDFEMKISNGKFTAAKNPSNDAGTIIERIMPQNPVQTQQPIAITESAPPAQTNKPQSASTSHEPANDSQSSESHSNLLEVRSPIVGTFYRSPSPDKGPYVKVGDTIHEGDVVCIVEAMKLFNEIESEIGGKIVKVLVEDASPVEYDQVLFLVEPV